LHIGIIVNAPGVYRYPKPRSSKKYLTSTIFGMPAEIMESPKPLKQFLAGGFREILAFREMLEQEHVCDIVLFHYSKFIHAEEQLTPKQFHDGVFNNFDIHSWLEEVDTIIIVISSDLIAKFLCHFENEMLIQSFIVAGKDGINKLSKKFINSTHLLRKGVTKIDKQNRKKILMQLES
jgi:hypothetical protein